MKKRSILSISLAIILCFSSLFVSAVSALTMGDVDGDGEVKAADARLALRASVGLENLSEDQKKAADVDYDGQIKAADARIILRASVGLEEIEDREIKFNGHLVESDCIGIEKGIVCIDSECCGETLMPSFNELVNALKEPGSLNYFFGFTKSTTITPEPTAKANGKNKSEELANLGLAEVMESLLADTVVPGTVTEFSDLTNPRHVNNATFFVKGKPYISDLKDTDVESVAMEKMNGVDFLKNLPDSFQSSVSKETYDLTKIKGSEISDVYKVTLTLKPETISNSNLPENTTPIEKILNDQYNDGIIESITDLNSEFNEMPEMADMLVMEMSITTKCTVTYYFTADTFAPVAATYFVDMNTLSKMHTYFNMLLKKTDSPTTTTTIQNNSIQENYFFFNDFFSAK